MLLVVFMMTVVDYMYVIDLVVRVDDRTRTFGENQVSTATYMSFHSRVLAIGRVLCLVDAAEWLSFECATAVDLVNVADTRWTSLFGPIAASLDLQCECGHLESTSSACWPYFCCLAKLINENCCNG